MVRPVLLQDNLAKTQAAERVNQILKAQSEMEQRQLAAALKEQAAAQLAKAHPLEKSDMVIIDRKERDKEKRKDEKKKNEQNESSEDTDTADDPPHLDLKA